MTAVYPSSVDLRSDIDSTYYQGPTNQCNAFSPKSAIETMYDRSPTHKGKRVSNLFIYWYGRKEGGGNMGDVGITPEGVSEAIKRYGVCEESDFGPGENIYTEPGLAANLRAQYFLPAVYERMPFVDDSYIKSIKRSVCWGIPPVVVFDLTADFWNIPPGPWKGMRWNPIGPKVFAHAMTCIGYDDASKTALFENSWGSQNGDQGFYGVPYSFFDNQSPDFCVASAWRFEKMPVRPVKVDGFMPEIAELNYAELAPIRAAMEAQRAAWNAKLEPHIPANITGWQWLIDACAVEGVTDRQLEFARKWTRGTVREFVDNPANGVTRGAMIFEPL